MTELSHAHPGGRVPDHGRGCRGARCVRTALPGKRYCDVCLPFARGAVDTGPEIVPVEILTDRGDVSCSEAGPSVASPIPRRGSAPHPFRSSRPDIVAYDQDHRPLTADDVIRMADDRDYVPGPFDR